MEECSVRNVHLNAHDGQRPQKMPVVTVHHPWLPLKPSNWAADRQNIKHKTENCVLLVCYVACSGDSLPSHLLGSRVWPLKTGPTGSTETSVSNYHYSLRNTPEERSSHTLRGGKPLISQTKAFNHVTTITSTTRDLKLLLWLIQNVSRCTLACH
jgi:hypothetical protein